MLRHLAIALAALVCPVAASAIPAGPPSDSPAFFRVEDPKVDSAKIRFGQLAQTDLAKDKVGVVNSKTVYLAIPSYKTIVKDKVEKGSARYIKLMEEATAAYRAALEKIAKDKSIKLIVEIGGVSGVKTSDLTDAIIEAL